MSNAPLVSIVVPTFRRSRHLREALRSALDQTCCDFEVIVTDDASPDPYAEAIVAELNDSRFRVRRNSINLGQAGNNLAAFHECRGEFVANLHDDDVWEPTFLEQLTGPLQANPDVVLAFSDHWVIDEDGRVRHNDSDENSARWGRTGLTPGRHQPFLDLAVVRQTVPVAMASVWRRSAVPWQELPAVVNAAYDFHLAYLAARDGGAAWYVPQRLTRYRVHSNNVTTGSGLTFPQSNVNSRRLILADPRAAAVRSAISRALGNSCTALGLGLLASGQPGPAREHLWTGFRCKPGLRPVVGLILSLLPPTLATKVVKRIRRATPL